MRVLNKVKNYLGRKRKYKKKVKIVFIRESKLVPVRKGEMRHWSLEHIVMVGGTYVLILMGATGWGNVQYIYVRSM